MPAERHVEHQIVPGRRLGKRPRDHSRPVMRLADILTGTVPDHPPAVDYLSRVPEWLLGSNDAFGTCGPTSLANHLLLTTTWLADTPITLTDDDIFDLYHRSGNPDFDPTTGDDDNGVEMTVMLAEAVKNGIGGHQPLAFAAVDPTNPDETWAAGAIFGGVLWGADLSVAQQQQAIWDYEPDAPEWGGHAVMAAARYTDATGTEQDRTGLISWAEVFDATDSFMSHELAEQYVVIWPWHLGTKAFQQGVDQARLAAAYKALTGREFPVAPDPGPINPPQPPGPSVDEADRTLASTVRPQLTHLSHHGPPRIVHHALRAWLDAKGL